MSPLKLSKAAEELLRCPICRAKLRLMDGSCQCLGAECGKTFPIQDGVPVLFNEDASLFFISDVVSVQPPPPPGFTQRLKRLLAPWIPDVSKNIKGRENYSKLESLLAGTSVKRPLVLVVGGRILGQGMEVLTERDSIDLVETDVSIGPRTALVCDSHDIPFANDSFDAVIVQAVLEHVLDPYRCVEEIHRVLKPGGIVYAETPFMQQVHAGAYDFTRFTRLGHRRLFRKFDEIESGAVCGPGMALAWSWQYFLLSFVTSKPALLLMRLFSCLTSFFLKYLDYYLIDKPGAYDAASGYYFMGRKAAHILPDRELIKLYKGQVFITRKGS